MRIGAVLLLSLSACGARHAPPLDPETFLVAGVDPHGECDAERDALMRAGLVLTRRLDEPRFCALGLASPDGRRSAVRIVTGRGVQLALDGDADAVPATHTVSLVAPPRGSPPAREVLVARDDPGAGRTCIDVVRVFDDDTVRSAAVELDAIADRIAVTPAPCIESVRDVDDDGRYEALVVVRIAALALPAALVQAPDGGFPTPRIPTVEVPLAARGDSLGPLLALSGYWQSESARRAPLLAHARAALDLAGSYVLAVELAAIALLSGEGRDASLAAYDDALRGLVLDAAAARAIAATRERIAHGLGASTH